METFGLFKLNEYIKRVIALNFPDALWIKAEISQIKMSRGSYYLDLIEKDEHSDEVIAKASGIMWFKTISFLRKKFKTVIDSILDTGNEIRIKVRVQFDERYGYSLIIEDLDASYTLGKAELLRQETLNRLQDEGLLELNNRLNLPEVLQNIAIISSESAAGYKDFINHILHNNYGYKIHYDLYQSAVQGRSAETEIVEAIKTINDSGIKYDCIVIIRGGGSKLDLAAFDNYNIAVAIAKSKLPVITGIGHEIDQSIADVVSHTTLKTPTAVADFIIERILNFESEILNLGLKIRTAWQDRINNETNYLDLLSERLIQKSKSELLSSVNFLSEKENLIAFYSKQILKIEKQNILNQEKNLALLSPENVLKRGFALISYKGRFIQSVRDIKPELEIETKLKDGSFKSIIK